MEQIQRAVARAKAARGFHAERSGMGHQPSHAQLYASTSTNKVETVKPEPPRLEPQPVDLSAIEYTQTKVIPCDRDALRERRVVAHLDHDPAGSVFRVLRSQLLQKARMNDVKTLAVLGPTPGVGKSMVAANLAVAISRETNQTVLLVDLDLRKPRIASYFGFEPEYGIADYLAGDIQIQDMLVNPGFERLVVLPGSRVSDQASEMLTSSRMVDLLAEMRDRYASRIILVDLPPLLATDDAIALLPYIDAGMLVVEDGVTTADQIDECKRLLSDTLLLGSVVNKSESRANSAYYGYADA